MKLRHFIAIVFAILVFGSLKAQTTVQSEEGTVSYRSSQNVYVKFPNTDNIAIGDTLYTEKEGNRIPILVVTNKSSSSCVCEQIGEEQIEVGASVLFFKKIVIEQPAKKEDTVEQLPSTDVISPKPLIEEAIIENEEDVFQPKEKIRARISAATYSTLSNIDDNHRMRYAVNFSGANINDSRFSFDSYLTFRHTQGEWDLVKNDIGRALKVYSLAGKYDFDKTSNLTFGRKINPRMSSLGAIDGFQYEKGLGQFVIGGIAGTRPDVTNYGFNANLLQIGAFVGHVSDKKYERTTLGFVEQHNGGAVDRRFVYFQHSSNLAKNLNLFSSFEVDAYEKVNGEVNNQPRLTNLYVSLRYRISKKLTISGSYDNRKNIIYYESYKSYIERLIDQETRQGLRFGVNIRPIKYVTIGANANWRFQQSNMNLSKNLNSYLNVSRIPGINARASLTANFLQNNYLNSRVLGLRLSKDFLKNKLAGEVYYKMVDYKYKTGEYTVQQQIGGASLNVRLMKDLSLYLYYEGTFDSQGNDLTRFNTKIIKRF